MSRIKEKFAQLAKQKKKALIPYVVAGDPQPNITVQLLHALVEAGADLIELGIPFSDPMAEGPVIQAAHERALTHGVTLKNVIQMVAEFRRTDKDTPVILMGYLNPIEQLGYIEFATLAHQAGVDGVLIVDLPPEEGTLLWQEMRTREIDPIFLLTPTTTTERIKFICQQSAGYHYYVSFKGVTGKGTLDVANIKAKLNEIRPYATLPIAVGFGIRDAESAASIAALADAVIVGSALVASIAAAENKPVAICQTAANFIKELRVALDIIK